MKQILSFLIVGLVLLSGCTGNIVTDENIKASIEMVTTDRSDVYDGVKTGMTKQQVEDKFGEPTKKQQMESDVGGMMEGLEDLGMDTDDFKMELEYWYYGNVQIGFMNGKVSTKIKI